MALMKLKTMLMQTFGVTSKEHYGMLWYFLEGSIYCSLLQEMVAYKRLYLKYFD